MKVISRVIVSSLALTLFACEGRADSFTLSLPSATLPAIPATPATILFDVPGPLPAVGVPGPALGLVPGDVIDAISDGLDPVFAPHIDYFSVTPASLGAPASGVALEFAFDTLPGVSPGHAADIFIAGGPVPPGTNILAPPGFGWTLGTTTGDEANTGLINPVDNVNSYDLSLTLPPGPIFFSLAAGSPSLIPGGFTPADIFVSAGAGGFGLFLPGAALGLPPLADIDALALDAPPGPLGIEYSLTAATAGPLGFSGADILGVAFAPGPMPIVVHPAGAIGLLPMDDLDALDLGLIPEPASISLFVVAFASLSMLRRRRG
jgi:hypothetical protein